VQAGTGAQDALREAIAEHDWYHTLELAPGVVTPGWFDTRRIVDDVPLPESLAGMRCLDVGTFDGFWAFEMERRGAGEVVAIDILDPARWDWPANSDEDTVREIGLRKAGGVGFELARRQLGSSVERRDLSVYDLDPDDIGMFDFAHLGSLLLHLRDPVAALMRLRGVCRGRLAVVETVSTVFGLLFPRTPVARLDAQGRPWWWVANSAGIVRMLEAGGFRVIGSPRRLRIPSGAGQSRPQLRPSTLLSPAGRDAALRAWRGDPHVTLIAEPGSAP
jgi:tRNA (mo5U34)-methyltransferase